MINPSRHTLLALVIVVCAAIAGAADSNEVTAPASRWLGDGPVELELMDADLVLRWDVSEKPRLDLWWSNEEIPGRISVQSLDTGDKISSINDPAVAGRALIELHLVPGQPVIVDASQTAIDAVYPQMMAVETDEDDETDEENQIDKEGETDEAAVPLDATASESDITLSGLPGARLDLSGGALFSSDGTGSWVLEADGGSVQIEDHSGDLRLTGVDCSARLDGLEGQLGLDATGGSLWASAVAGSVMAVLASAELAIESSQASIVVSGDSSNIELYDVSTSTVRITGSGHTLRLEDVAASAHINIGGGSTATVTGWSQRLDLTLREQSSAFVDTVDGDCAFRIDSSDLELRTVTKHVRGTATSARFTAENLRSLELAANNSEVTVTRARHLNKLEVIDCRVMLDLPNLRDKRAIKLMGASTADVRLPRPCQVRFFGAQPESGQASVTGCVSLSLNQNWQRQRKVHPDEPDLISLGVTLGPEATIDIVGD